MSGSPVTISTINARGWSRKRHAILNFVFQDSVDILAVTETWARPRSSISIPGFTVFRRDPPPDLPPQGKGTALFIKSTIPCKRFHFHNKWDHLDYVAVKLAAADGGWVTVTAFYNPPRARLPDDFLGHISGQSRQVLLGDLNARHVGFGDSATNNNGLILCNLLSSTSLCRVSNSMPTFVGNNGWSIVDHILCTGDVLATFDDNCRIGTTVTSDHMPLVVDTTVLAKPDPRPTAREIFDYRRANWALYHRLIEEGSPPPITIPLPAYIDTTVDLLTAAIQNARDKAVPVRTINLSRPALPPYILSLIREKRRIYRLYIKSKNPLLKTEFNRLSSLIRLKINKFKEDSWWRTCSSLTYRDGGKFWAKFKMLTGRHKRLNAPLHHNNTIAASDAQKAQTFASVLERTFHVPEGPKFNVHFKHHVNRATSDFLATPDAPGNRPIMRPFEEREVSDILGSMSKRAPGEDGLEKQALSHLPTCAVSLLTSIYNSCLLASYFPARWKRATTVMIPKPNKALSDPNSYRPIALLDHLGKILEKLINCRLRDYCDERSLLPASQAGFRKCYTTVDQVARLKTEAARVINRGVCAGGLSGPRARI